MHSQLFSNKTRGFYPIKSLRYYKSVDALPDDLVRVSDTEHEKFIGVAPVNCVPNYNVKSKQMEWLSVPPPAKTKEQLMKEAEERKNWSMNDARLAIEPLKDAVDLGIATKEEENLLLAWREYRVSLMRIDTSLAPEIEWPEPPEDVA